MFTKTFNLAIQTCLTVAVVILSCFEEKDDGIKNWPEGMMR